MFHLMYENEPGNERTGAVFQIIFIHSSLDSRRSSHAFPCANRAHVLPTTCEPRFVMLLVIDCFQTSPFTLFPFFVLL